MKYLLLQIRDANDPIGAQESDVFLRALRCESSQFHVFDLLKGSPTENDLNSADIVLIGGSGNYSAVDNDPWLLDSLETIRTLYKMRKPTFAICWGCQAMARALGGEVIHDAANGELGATTVHATDDAADDSLFGPLGTTYSVFQGHEDRVTRLPDDAVLLARTEKVPVQAFTFADRPIYATQFHPELTRDVFLERVASYPHYVEKITGQSYDQFKTECGDAIEAHQLLRRFVQLTMAVK